MRKEAAEAGVDYVVSVDERGCLAEGAAENVGLVTAEGDLVFPRFDRVLSGITLSRVLQLTDRAQVGDIPLEEAYRAREMMLLGTSLDILPVVEFDGRPIGEGVPGPVARRLRQLIIRDILNNLAASTNVLPGQAEEALCRS